MLSSLLFIRLQFLEAVRQEGTRVAKAGDRQVIHDLVPSQVEYAVESPIDKNGLELN